MTEATVAHPPFKFTQAKLDALPFESTRYEVRDTQQPGLICRVSPPGRKYPDGRRVLQVYGRAKGITAPIRVTICEVGELPLTALKGQASVRGRVDEILAQLRAGENPNETARQLRADKAVQAQADELAGVTLKKAYQAYLKTKALRPRTIEGYQLIIDRDLVDWKDKPLREITGAMAVTRHAEISQTSRSVAMRAMQVLRAVHRFASEFYGDDEDELPFGRCPVDKVNRVQRKWSRSDARTRKLGTDDVRPWLEAVRRLPIDQPQGDPERMAAYLELLLLTGLRRREAGFMLWSDVDFKRGTIKVRETKNGKDHTLPMTARVREILEARKRARDAENEKVVETDEERKPADYVIGTSEVRKQLVRIEKTTGLTVTPHDLRRSWASFAERAGIGGYAIKAALNHATTGDVTGTNYVQLDTDDLRPLMQQVEDYILRLADPPANNVVELRSGAAA
ncbi:tyrosine-type recombinase/integrase [Thiocapsa bogorovii]|uniref:tyrosine-type recombinase/integrase n=1 Tax=Thiocapsa bogorovii TaxID=521689 RepID=UPI001E3C4765|nr:tyrosine-type recombinase/integrase [Thiocapsa bogorovii]UHD15732.1 tyrosine-type recombinase/integrase [Thiocapsa bogorovii]